MVVRVEGKTSYCFRLSLTHCFFTSWTVAVSLSKLRVDLMLLVRRAAASTYRLSNSLRARGIPNHGLLVRNYHAYRAMSSDVAVTTPAPVTEHAVISSFDLFSIGVRNSKIIKYTSANCLVLDVGWSK